MTVSVREFQEFKQEIEEALVATQADVDALTGQVGEVASLLGSVQADLAASAAAIQAEIQALQTGVDLSGLQAAVEPLSGTVQQVDDAVKALAPASAAAPEPAVEPAPEEPAPAPEAAPVGAEAPADATSEPTAAPAPATDSSQLSKPVYTTTLPPAGIDVTAWTASGYETENDPSGSPQALFYFNADTDGGAATGAGLDNGAWVEYSGAVQQVPAA